MMANNDQVFARSITTGRIQNGRETLGSTWTFVGGTGKFKNLRGKGTYQCKSDEAGVAECTSSGSYSLTPNHDGLLCGGNAKRDTARWKQHVKEAGGEAASVSGAVKGPLFGLDLNAEEKMARIAFLKTL
jgi:hypothetical protein